MAQSRMAGDIQLNAQEPIISETVDRIRAKDQTLGGQFKSQLSNQKSIGNVAQSSCADLTGEAAKNCYSGFMSQHGENIYEHQREAERERQFRERNQQRSNGSSYQYNPHVQNQMHQHRMQQLQQQGVQQRLNHQHQMHRLRNGYAY